MGNLSIEVKFIERRIFFQVKNRKFFKSRKIDVLTSLRMKDFGLINSNPHSPHLVVDFSSHKLMTTCHSGKPLSIQFYFSIVTVIVTLSSFEAEVKSL